MVGQRIGYVRVSSLDQNPERQLDGIEVDKVFTDKASGKDRQRPQLELLLQFVREGDTVVVHSMDRLARNLDDLRALVRELTGKGVGVQFIKENLRFTGDDTPMSTLLLSVMGAVAEFERALIRERQTEGIAIARAKGVYSKKGRHMSLKPGDVARLKERLMQPGVNKSSLAGEFRISRGTLYRYIDDMGDIVLQPR